MDSFAIGTTIRLRATITDIDTGLPVEPSSVVCYVQSPSGTDTEPVVQNPEDGVFTALTVPDEHGVWTYRFDGSGTIETAEEGSFFVRPLTV